MIWWMQLLIAIVVIATAIKLNKEDKKRHKAYWTHIEYLEQRIKKLENESGS